MLRFNDRVQAALFSGTRRAQTYPASAVTKPYRFNAYYQEWQVRETPADWQLELSGLIAEKAPWTIDKLRALPQEAQVTRHICIEGWSQIGQWSGVPLHVFLQRVGADLKARYVSFKCFDGYSTSIDMPSALQSQTILASISWASHSLPNGALRCGCGYRQSWFQECQEYQNHFRHQHLSRRLLGRPGLQLVLRIVIDLGRLAPDLVRRAAPAAALNVPAGSRAGNL
jgi:Oxidoreductase molybdopterin binding domain